MRASVGVQAGHRRVTREHTPNVKADLEGIRSVVSHAVVMGCVFMV
jgi:hypothetical protein